MQTHGHVTYVSYSNHSILPLDLMGPRPSHSAQLISSNIKRFHGSPKFKVSTEVQSSLSAFSFHNVSKTKQKTKYLYEIPVGIGE